MRWGGRRRSAFRREKRDCPKCKKSHGRSESTFFVPTAPHSTKEFAWWVNRLTSETSVLATSRSSRSKGNLLPNLINNTLRRLSKGYKIPQVKRIAVDEVYARGLKQLKEGENRDDLFFTVIVDIETHKVIWVSKSRRKAGARLSSLFYLAPKLANPSRLSPRTSMRITGPRLRTLQEGHACLGQVPLAPKL